MKIPNGWKPYEFGKAVSFNPKVKFQRGEQYTFIEMDDVSASDKFASGKEKRDYTTGSCSKFRNGDVLFARITPCLDNKKIATASIGQNQLGFGSTEFIVLRAKENITVQEYVHYLSKSEYIIQNAINSYVGASGRQRADAKFIKKVIIPLPKVSEQQRIASILSAYDDLIENNNKRITLLEQTAEQIYKEWFVRMRFPGYQEAEFEKGIPKGWEVKKLKQIVTTQYGFTATSEANSESGVKFLRITDVASSKIDWDNVPDCSISENEINKYFLHPGDIVVARTGATAGYAKRIHKLHPIAVFASYLVRLKTKDGRMNLYLGLIVQSNSYKEFIQSIAGGSAQPQANAHILTEMSILIPEITLLEAFNKVAEPLFDKAEILSNQNSFLKQTRDLLLPRLISGKLRVKDIKERKLMNAI